MNIQYKTGKLQRDCTEYRRARKEFGEEVAKRLHKAVNFIEQAESLMDVRKFTPFHFHALTQNLKGLCAIDLGRKLGFRLLVRPLEADGSAATNERIFSSNAIEIINIEFEEVSNHYE